MQLVGELVSAGELQLDGSFEGRLRCEQLTIGEGGSLKGEAEADTAVIKGHFSGQLVARSVRITATATVEGDIHQDNIAIEAGATIKGRLLLREQPAADEPSPPAGTQGRPAGSAADQVIGIPA